MEKYVASPSCVKLHIQSSYIKGRGCATQNSCFRIPRSCRTYSYGSCKVVRHSTSKTWELSHTVSNLKVSPCLRETSLKCTCLGSFVNRDGATASDWISVVDQVLLMASIFLTYTAGVIPGRKPRLNYQKNIYDDDVVAEGSTSSGSAVKNDDQVGSKYALDVVKGKLLDSLDAFEHGHDLGYRVLEFEENRTKRPLSLNAVAEGPRLRLLWASFQQVEEEVNNISRVSKTAKMDNCLTVFLDVVQKSCQPVCLARLEKELHLQNSDTKKINVEVSFEVGKSVSPETRSSIQHDLLRKLWR